jgi:ribonuclease P protein component
VTVFAAPRGDHDDARLGLAIRAGVGTAVMRNKLRRRIRAIFSAYDPVAGYDVIVQPSRDATGKNYQELSQVVGVALDRAGVGSVR